MCVERPQLRHPAGCDTWACPWCGPRQARRRAAVLAWAAPARFVTLTQAPDNWQALRARLRKLTLKVRAEGYACEWAWTVEQGTQTGMRHIHALQHGDYIPQRTLERLWSRRVDIRAIRGRAGAAAYAMKEAGRVAGYAMKGSHGDLLAHLDRNGGRGCHYTRAYLHGRRLREVEAILWPSQPDLTWVLVDCHESTAEVVARFS